MLPEQIQAVYERSTCLYSREQVEAALDKMAEAIHNECEEKNPIFLCVMIGGMVPAGQLLTRLDFHMEVDYIHATRYRGQTKGGHIHWKVRPSVDLKGRCVIVVDDILDGGLTLTAIKDYCEAEGADKVYTAVLVDKPAARDPKGIKTADFTGLEVENLYVFGYGMDYKEYLRNAPGIYAVAKQDQ